MSNGDGVNGVVVYVHGTGDRVARGLGGHVLDHVKEIDTRFRSATFGFPVTVRHSDWGDQHGSDQTRLSAAVPPDPDARQLFPPETQESLSGAIGEPSAAEVQQTLDRLRSAQGARDVAGLVDQTGIDRETIAEALRDAANEVAGPVGAIESQTAELPVEVSASTIDTVAERASRSLMAREVPAGDAELAWPQLPKKIRDALRLSPLAFPVLAVAADTAFGGAFDNPDHRQNTDTIKPYRADILVQQGMRGVTDILRYLRNGETTRQHVRRELADAVRVANGRKVIALGNSLGGIILAEVLAEARADDDVALCDLFVTVGSQPGAMHAIGALGESASEHPFTPWLNIFDGRDFMGFLAEGVWGSGLGILDRPVDSGRGFPHSHGAGYFRQDEVVRLMIDRLKAADKVTDAARIPSSYDKHDCPRIPANGDANPPADAMAG